MRDLTQMHFFKQLNIVAFSINDSPWVMEYGKARPAKEGLKVISPAVGEIQKLSLPKTQNMLAFHSVTVLGMVNWTSFSPEALKRNQIPG